MNDTRHFKFKAQDKVPSNDSKPSAVHLCRTDEEMFLRRPDQLRGHRFLGYGKRLLLIRLYQASPKETHNLKCPSYFSNSPSGLLIDSRSIYAYLRAFCKHQGGTYNTPLADVFPAVNSPCSAMDGRSSQLFSFLREPVEKRQNSYLHQRKNLSDQ